MFVSMEGLEDIAWHGNVQRPCNVIPGEFNATVKIAAPIFAQFLYLSFIAVIK